MWVQGLWCMEEAKFLSDDHPFRFLFLALLLGASSWRSLPMLAPTDLEGSFPPCSVLFWFWRSIEGTLSSSTEIPVPEDFPNILRFARAAACEIFVFTWCCGVPDFEVPCLQKWQTYVMLLASDLAPVNLRFLSLVMRTEQFTPTCMIDSHLHTLHE